MKFNIKHFMLVGVALATLVGGGLASETKHAFRGLTEESFGGKNTTQSRWLHWNFFNNREVEMCCIVQTNPTKFRTVRVSKKNVDKRLAQGFMHGPCTTPKNCKKLCPNENDTCDARQCIAEISTEDECKPVTCAEDEVCECRCEDAQRLLCFPDPKKVQMCRIDQTDPIKFRTIKVPRNRVRQRLAQGILRGACNAPDNCKKLCPVENETCDSGQCVAISQTLPQCIGPMTCPGQRCICECRLGYFGKKFAAQSFVEGLYHEETQGKVNITTDEGLDYEVSANLTTRREGIVSLADASGLIASVTCVNNSAIKIEFEDSLNEDDDLQDMFPVQAILVVKADVFGYCMDNPIISNPINEEIDYDRDLYQLADDGGDGYLIISNAIQDSVTTVTVVGNRGSFFDMFYQGNIQFRKIDDQDRRQLLPRSLQVENTWKYWEDYLIVKYKGKITDSSGIGWANFDFGPWGFTLKVGIAVEFKITMDIETYLEAGLSVPKYSEPKYLISVPIGPPPAKLLTFAQKAGVFNLLGDMPEMKVGLYMELSSYLELAQASVVLPIGPQVKVELTSGRKEVSIDAVFKPFSSQYGATGFMVKNESPSLDYNMTINDGDREIRFELFLAFQPQLMMYVTDLFLSGVGLPFGPELYLNAGLDEFYPPKEDEIGGPVLIGYCNTCHHLQGSLTSVLKSPIGVWRILEDWNVLSLVEDATLREEILNLCLWRPFGADTIVCEKTCCDGSATKCESGRCVGNGPVSCIVGEKEGECLPESACKSLAVLHSSCLGETGGYCCLDPIPCKLEEGYTGTCIDAIQSSKCDLALASNDCPETDSIELVCCLSTIECTSSDGRVGKCVSDPFCPTGSQSVDGECPTGFLCCAEQKLLFTDGFECEDNGSFNFALNSNLESYPFPQLLKLEPDNPASLCFLRMTRDKADHVGTSAFASFNFLDQNSDFVFSTSIGYRIFGANDGSADGIAFVMHQDPRGVNAVGGGGAYMGVYEYGDVEAIKPAIIIEMDTFENTYVFDNGRSNIHILSIDSDGKISELAETGHIDIRTDDSGMSAGRMWVEPCSDNNIRVFINNAGDEKPPDPQLVTEFDFTSLFNGGDVFWGYTASTWLEGDNQDIMSLTFDPVCNSEQQQTSFTCVESMEKCDRFNCIPCTNSAFYTCDGFEECSQEWCRLCRRLSGGGSPINIP